MMKRMLAAGAICLMAVTAVVAAENMHESREAAMKKIGGAMGGLVAIAKGQKPYDADTVKTLLTTISETIKVFPDYFPKGSENDDKAASPKIWENMDDFKARAAKLSADTETVLAQLPADAAGVGAALNAVGGNCGGCHQLYRIKKD